MTFVRVRPLKTRLGNWMFQYAAAKSFADGGDVAFVIEREAEHELVEKYRSVFPDVKIVTQAPDGAEVLDGFFQDVRYLKENVVRTLFRKRDEYAGRIPPGMVAIHVRRGDYLHLPHRNPFVGEDYLRKAVASFPPDVRFLVFSDDLTWCRKFFSGPRFSFAESGSAIDDLFLMSWCDHHICSNSTFSWWGAYLRHGGRTVFPSMWVGMALRQSDYRGLYFEGVEVIRNRYTPGRFLLALPYMARGAVRRMRRWCLRRWGLWRVPTDE